MAVYYVETGAGCGLRVGKRKDQALRDELREVGTNCGVRIIRIATQEDIDWVAGMGGNVPEEAQAP